MLAVGKAHVCSFNVEWVVVSYSTKTQREWRACQEDQHDRVEQAALIGPSAKTVRAEHLPTIKTAKALARTP